MELTMESTSNAFHKDVLYLGRRYRIVVEKNKYLTERAGTQFFSVHAFEIGKDFRTETFTAPVRKLPERVAYVEKLLQERRYELTPEEVVISLGFVVSEL